MIKVHLFSIFAVFFFEFFGDLDCVAVQPVFRERPLAAQLKATARAVAAWKASLTVRRASISAEKCASISILLSEWASL